MKGDEGGDAPGHAGGWPAPCDYGNERQWLDTLAEREILRLRARYELSLDELRGLYISDRQVDALLRDRGRRIAADNPGAETLRDPVSALTAQASQWRAHFARNTPLDRLAFRWPLSTLEADIVLLALAPDLDLRYETLWAYLNNDIGRRTLSTDLAQRMLGANDAPARAAIGAALARLTHDGLVDAVDVGESRGRLATGYRVATPLLRYLRGEPAFAEGKSIGTVSPRLQWMRVDATTAGGDLVLVWADDGQHARWIEQRACERGRHLLWSGESYCLATREQLMELGMVARLASAMLVLERCHAHDAGPASDALRAALARWRANGVDVVLCLARNAPAPPECDQLAPARVMLPRDDTATRGVNWAQEIARGGLAEGAAAAQLAAVLARRFHFGPRAIAAAAEAARAANPDVPARALAEAACEHTSRALARVATCVRRRHDWSQLVLPPATLALLREVAAAIGARERVYGEWQLAARSGRGSGLAVLFAGASGTGKTMAACVLAEHVGLELYRVDLAGVVSKYIGETEKNLERVFAAARDADALLLFDEADALLGKRAEVKDAHDRYANLEVAYLLQKMEEHDGVVILASNLPKNLDSAFARRLHYAVEFPRPGAELRERIWRGVLAPPVACAPDVDYAKLAVEFELTGGEIQSLVLEAAFAAAAADSPIDSAHLARVLERHRTRQGTPVRATRGPALAAAPRMG